MVLRSWTKLSDDRLLNLLARDEPPPKPTMLERERLIARKMMKTFRRPSRKKKS